MYVCYAVRFQSVDATSTLENAKGQLWVETSILVAVNICVH